MVNLLAIPFVFFLPGYSLIRLCSRERSAAIYILALLLSLPFTSVAAFGLAAVGHFTIWALVLTNILMSVPLLLLQRRTGSDLGFAAVFDLRFCLLALLMATGLFLYYSPPFEYYFGGRDPGIYTMNGIRIARTGSITAQDPVVSAVPQVYRPLFFTQRASLRYMGFYIYDLSTARVVPNFFYLYPVWLAIFYALFGIHGMLYATPFLICSMLIVFAFFARSLIGRTASLCAMIILGSNAIYLWFARFPNSEILAGALVFTGLLCLHWYQTHSSLPLGLLGAASLGVAFWSRVDASLIAIPFVFWLLFRWMDKTARKRDLWILFIYSLFLLIGLFYGLHANRQYMLAAFANLKFKPYKVVATVAGALFVIGSLAYAGRRLEIHARSWPGKVFAAGLGMLIFYAYAIRPFYPSSNLGSPNAGALLALGWYFTHPVVALGLIGFVLYSRKFTAINWIFLAATLFYSCLYFYRIRGHAEHFWMLRRYLIFVCPALVIFSLYSAENFFRRLFRGNRRLTDVTIVFITCVLAGLYWNGNRQLHQHQEFRGSYAFIESIARRIGPNDVLLLGSREGNDLHIIGPMLSYYFDRNVLQLRSREPNVELLAGWIRSVKGKVYFAGTGAANMASDKFYLNPMGEIHFETPVYDEIYHRRPDKIFSKYFQIGWYHLDDKPAGNPYFVDIGKFDDGSISNFHLKESYSGVTYRWTNGQGHVYFPPTQSRITSVVLRLNPGPWVPGMERVHAKIHINGLFLVDLILGNGYNTYEVPVPATMQQQLQGVPIDVRIDSKSWIPKRLLNLPDTRRVGVIVDWVQLKF